MAKTTSHTLSVERLTAIEDAVAALAEPLMPHGVALVAVALEKEFGRWRLQIAIEQPPAGVSLDICQAVSEALDARLDDLPALADLSYDLEVSSPGVDRLLKSARELRFYRGRAVTLRARRPGKREPLPVTSGLLGDYDPTSGALTILNPDDAERPSACIDFNPATLEIRLNTPVTLPDPL
ncbi:MAG: hypothetical protein IPK79_05860 [Vampirovibrionales bacterium]|nr:hypothetical protein [Vampirovibrionales bacterium]